MDLDFLLQAATADSNARLMILLPDGTLSQIHKVSPFAILDKCPLLYHAFEFGPNSIRQANIEATSRSAVVSLLRYLYTGAYVDEDRPCSLLDHAEAFKIGEDYDVPELQVSAYVEFTRETEFACSLSTPPPDLCQTIRFLYTHLASQRSRQEQSLLDTLLNYCLATFKYQGLDKCDAFRQVVFETPAFHRDLCRTSMQRNFEDEGATDLVLLPVCHPTPHSRDNVNKRALGDFQFELWQDTEEPTPNTDDISAKSQNKRRKKSEIEGSFTLVHRPKNPNDLPTSTESDSDSESSSSSDESGFTVVRRPKINIDTSGAAANGCSGPSSAELFPDSPTIKLEPQDPTLSKPIFIKVEPEEGDSSGPSIMKAEPCIDTVLKSPDDEWDLL